MRMSAFMIELINVKLSCDDIIITDDFWQSFKRDIIDTFNRIMSMAMCFMSFSDSSSTIENPLVDQRDELWSRLTVKTIGTKSNNSTLERETLIRSGLKQLVIYATKLKDFCKESVPSNLQWNNILYGNMILFLKEQMNKMNSGTTFAGREAGIHVFRVQNRPGDGFNPITVLKTKNRKEVLYGEL